jgi:hypothetical protein
MEVSSNEAAGETVRWRRDQHWEKDRAEIEVEEGR